MSGVASAPPSSSVPSAARADDLFALAKFVQSEDAQQRLLELQEAEKRAIEERAAADLAIASAKQTVAVLQKRAEEHAADVDTFERVRAAHIEDHAKTSTELVAREALVLAREDRATQRERDHAAMLAAGGAELTQRDARLSQREAELDARVRAHEAERASFERRRTAIDQAMRS